MSGQNNRQADLEEIVRTAMQQVLQAVSSSLPPVTQHLFYGAIEIDPRHLVTWYVFKTDWHLQEAERCGLNTTLSDQTRAELRSLGYPPHALDQILVRFTSEEDVEREAGGNWWHYFK